MAHLIDKDALVAEIRRMIKNAELYIEHHSDNNDRLRYSFEHQRLAMCELLSFLDTLEVREVDLKKETTHYLLHEHCSPLNEIIHKADLKAEMQYHKDIENAFKTGFELGLKVKKGE